MEEVKNGQNRGAVIPAVSLNKGHVGSKEVGNLQPTSRVCYTHLQDSRLTYWATQKKNLLLSIILVG